jgi:hypothetical protein
MPLTQEQIGETLGITPVHANRIIKRLRDENFVDINRGGPRCWTKPSLRNWRNSTTAIFIETRRFEGRGESFFEGNRVVKIAALLSIRSSRSFGGDPSTFERSRPLWRTKPDALQVRTDRLA